MIDLRRVFAPLIKPRAPEKCEACGAEFACGASLKGCWCMKVETTEETRAELKEKYQRCLCRACLEKFAADETTETDNF